MSSSSSYFSGTDTPSAGGGVVYFNDNELSKDVVHPLAFTRSDGLVCNDFGVLMSDWPAGEYKLKTVATFNDKINDGMADYAAGDYVVEYNVTVQK